MIGIRPVLLYLREMSDIEDLGFDALGGNGVISILADVFFRDSFAKLTPDRAAYLSHPDWTADPAKRPPADLWHPQVPTPLGLAETAAWYRANGLL